MARPLLSSSWGDRALSRFGSFPLSDAARQNLKVSREGIVLIKSFEGFRPRAIQRAEGGWIIGYGHTLSAREGASVSESDAELLLRYDLLPVEKTVNDAVPQSLNQHQFDALVSFAFSVGVDDFAGSDVRQRLNAGSPGEAADAIMGWPEPVLPETALRRRAAERALFGANPATPVALSDLLSAPLPTPPVSVPAPPEQPQAEPETTDGSDVEAPASVDPRGAAVAALLGEPPVVLTQDEPSSQPIIPTFATPSAPPPAPANEDSPVEQIPGEQAPVEQTHADAEPASTTTPASDALDAPAVDGTAATEIVSDPAPSSPAQTASRYAPYSLSMVGPLPYLVAATPRAEPDHADAATDSAPTAADTQTIAPVETEATPAEPESSAVEALDAPVEPIDAAQAEQPVPPVAAVETYFDEPALPFMPIEARPFDAPAPTAELILTPLEDAPEPAFARPLWTPEERTATDPSETNLFGEDLTLTLGGAPVMRHEIETEAPARFDWSETGPLIFMSGVGLVSFGASMVAFRRAAEQSGGNELTAIGWVLALIGLACVGVSSVNLYRKFGLPGGD